MNKKNNFTTKKIKSIALYFCLFLIVSCTEQTKESFRYIQQEQSFSLPYRIDSKIDILWVIDNSTSMDVSQTKIRRGFQSFAKNYLKPYWDIRIAAIPTDLYIANPAFNDYLNQVVVKKDGSSNWLSIMEANYHTSTELLSQWNNNLSNAGVNFSLGSFTLDLLIKNIIPAWANQYSLLKNGIHDGPIAALCFEILPYFINGKTQCKLRDDIKTYGNVGPDKCLNENLLNKNQNETSENQCVNTILNDSIHSQNPIVSTKKPETLNISDDEWIKTITQNFMMNLSKGTTGHGSERGLASILQLLEDNEQNLQTQFFRKDSTRIIIIVSDEDDQSMYVKQISNLPQPKYIPMPNSDALSSIALSLNQDNAFSPWSHYQCDFNTTYNLVLQKLTQDNINAQAPLTQAQLEQNAKLIVSRFCCNTGNCLYGKDGTTCPTKILDDGTNLTLSVCPNKDYLIPVSEIKKSIDMFFIDLDQNTNSNLTVIGIFPLSSATIKALQDERYTQDDKANVIRNAAVDFPTRYLEFINLVGNNSYDLDISSEDYSSILNQIGKKIIEKVGSFTLERPPTSLSEMSVVIKKSNGTTITVSNQFLKLNGKVLTITDEEIVLGLTPEDQILINYQPSTAY